MRLDRPTRSFRLLQTDRTSEDCLRDKRRSSHSTTKLLNGNLHDNVYLALLEGNVLTVLFDMIELIGSTRPRFDA